MDTAVAEGTIPGRCHPFGPLHRCHRVQPTFTQCPEKSRPIKYAGQMHGLMIAIEYCYKLDRKNYFNLWCELGRLLLRQSQMGQPVCLVSFPLLNIRLPLLGAVQVFSRTSEAFSSVIIVTLLMYIILIHLVLYIIF